jgi:rare lipoprotein A
MNWSYRQCQGLLWAGLGLLLLSAGCRKNLLLVPVPGSPDLKIAHSEIYGIASWYGDPFHGERTSNGEIYDMHAMTAAHRTLPFATVVRVHNLDNGKRVHVRVNDRGPFVRGRIIDLSHAAAQEIDMVRPGTARVRLEILRIEATAARLAVQVGSFTEEPRAYSLKGKLEGDYDPVTVSLFRTPRGSFHRVLVGDFPTRAKAMDALEKLRSQGLEGFVTRRD